MKSENLLRSLIDLLGTKDTVIFKKEEQNSDYEGAILQINNNFYRTRRAKLTPKKKGYFVAVWEKDATNTNQAYHVDESPEKLIISIIDDNKYGQFIFPKTALLTYGIFKNATQKGKMAFRVYPSWITELNTTAKKTQAWQIPYFIDLSTTYDIEKLNALYLE